MNYTSKKSSVFRYFYILFAAALLYCPTCSLYLYAQETGTLRGLVTDSTSAEVLAFASVYIQELKTGAFTDSKGYFIISSIPADKQYSLIVSYTGYHTRKISFNVKPGKMQHLDIKLAAASILLPTVEKVEKKYGDENATDISLQRLSIKELDFLPKGVETDIIRSLHYIPGVRSTGDISARYYIRGGASNQNLVQINNSTIYNPFHALGLFSVVDPEIVNSAEFYKGGFPAEYSGRLSSVLNMSLKDGNKNRYSGKASASYLSAKALIEGPIPNGSFIAAGRKSISNQIYKKFINKDLPLDFYDMAFKLNYSNPEFVEGSKILVHGFMSSDNVIHDTPSDADLKWSNSVFGFSWFQISDNPLFFEVGLSFSNFNGEIIPNASSARQKKNEVYDVNMKMDFHYVYESRDELGVALNILNLDTRLNIENNLGASSNLNAHGTNFALYAKYKFLRFKNLGIELGNRINLSGLTKEGGQFFNEPRFSFTFKPFREVSIKGAWGIFQQEITTLSDENELISLFEPWIIVPNYLKPARSNQYILGFETILGNHASFEVEGYYKKSENIAAINERKIYASDYDFIAGNGESYGLETMLKLNFGPFHFNGGYSLGWAYNEINKWLFYPKYDARHSCNLTADYGFEGGWLFSAVWSYSTGLPFTKIAGFYDKMTIDDLFTFSNLTNSFYPYLLLADKNLGRLPSYHRLDLSLSKKFVTDFFNMYLDVSILNVYNRKNLFYFERDTGSRINMLPFLPTATLKLEI